MKILVLYPQKSLTSSNAELVNALRSMGHVVHHLSFEWLECSYLKSFDLVFLRGLPYYRGAVELNALITCLRSRSVINDPRASLNARDKFTSMKVLEEAGVPVPKTYLVGSKAELLRLIEEMGEGVLKPVSGSLGFGVTTVNKISVFYLNLPNNFLAVFQEKLEKVRDVRVIATENKAIAAMYRISHGHFVTNYFVTHEADPAPVEPYEEVAVRAVRALGLKYGGVDLIEMPEGPKVIEVNPSPLWKGLSKVTRKPVLRELLVELLGDEMETGAEG